MFSKTIILILVITVTFAEDEGSEGVSEEATEIRDQRQHWRTVDYFPLSQQQDTSEWIPRDQFMPEQQIPKRRRIRKRKRRPPVITESEETFTRRSRRPENLDQSRDPWDEMVAELNPQPYYSRRRVSPIYDEPVEKIRDPFTALMEAEEKQKVTKTFEDQLTSTQTPDLKTLLKQNSGGLSLSEILQQKNLSLAELLMGNQEAILALTEKTIVVTTEYPVDESSEEVMQKSKYTRLPPSIGLKKNIERNFEQFEDSTETFSLTSEEVLEAQRKRLNVLNRGYDKESKIFADVTKKFDVVTEESTEKRIFVPAKSNLYTSIDYRPEVFSDIKTVVPETTTNPQVSSKSKSLPLTSAKLIKLTAPKNQKLTELPENAVTISVNEIFGFQGFEDTTKYSTMTSTEGPLKMNIDLDETITRKENLMSNEVIKQLAAPTQSSVVEKVKHVTAKEEISEILKNPKDREYLFRILRLRNMTVEELVEQRERGSSQLHLADIFHNETREPEPNGEPSVGVINLRQQKSKSVSTVVKKDSATIKPTKVVVTTSPQELYTITSFPTYKIESNKGLKDKPPLLQDLFPSFFPEVSADSKNRQEESKPTINYDDLKRIEEIENHLSEVVNDRLNVDLNPNLFDNSNNINNIDEEEEFINLPSGVKSAILASLAIIGLSLVVFLTILVIFKWSQRQKRKLDYSGSYSGSKIESPILKTEQNKRSLRTFMTETLGRKKNYYKSHLQSMSDNIWQNEKKSYMI